MNKPRYYFAIDGENVSVITYEDDLTMKVVDHFKLDEANDAEGEYGVRRMYQKTLPLITLKHE